MTEREAIEIRRECLRQALALKASFETQWSEVEIIYCAANLERFVMDGAVPEVSPSMTLEELAICPPPLRPAA